MQLKNKGVEVSVVTSGPTADTPEALRVASDVRNVFRTNPYSDLEEAEPKVTQVATEGKLRTPVVVSEQECPICVCLEMHFS